MTLEESIKEIVAEAVKEAFDKHLAEHLEALRAAHEPSRLLAEALAGGDAEEIREMRLINSLQYLDANDTAKLLGIGRHTVYALIRSGALRATKVGNRAVMRRTDIDEMMARHEVLDTVKMTRDTKRALRRG